MEYSTKLDKYNARHARARKRGKRWANKRDHDPKPGVWPVPRAEGTAMRAS